MNIERISIDLKQEKKELDDFLSRLEERSTWLEENAQTETPIPSPPENPPLPESIEPEISALKLETPETKPEEVSRTLRMENDAQTEEEKIAPEPALSLEMEVPALELERPPEKLRLEEKPDSPMTESPSLRFEDTSEKQTESAPEVRVSPAFASLDIEEAPETAPKIDSSEPPQRYSAKTESDRRTASDEPEIQDASLQANEKITKKPETKKSKSAAMDFAPEKESSSTGKWIGIGIGTVLAIILIAGLAWYFLS